MVLELVGKHKSLAKDKPRTVTAWLSMIAFDDISEFAKLTDITFEQLIQSLVFRLRDFLQYTDHYHSQKNLEVGGMQTAV